MFRKSKMTKEEKRAGIKHECELEPEENEFALAQMVSVGWCISLRRFFWNAIMISQDNSRTFTTYKSSYVVRMENVRKLKMGNHVIHPFSAIRTFWELYMCIVFGIIYFIPINLMTRYCVPVVYLLVASNYLDILLSFLTGFQYENTRLVICDYYLIAKHYICTTFFVDAIAVVCYSMHNSELYPSDHQFLKYLQFVIIIRMYRFITYAGNIRASYNSHTSRNSLITIFMPFIILLIWLYQIQFAGIEEELCTLQGVLRGLSNIGNMDYYVENNLDELTVYIICAAGGYLLELLFFAFALRAIQKYTHLLYKYAEILLQMERYATNNNLPQQFKKGIFTYMQYLYANDKFQEHVIFDTLPLSLQHELSISLYSQLIEKSATFNGMPMEIILKLTARLTRANFMPMEVIISHGTVATCMYFIYRGMVAIYTASGKEVCHLNHGSSFGELCIFEEEVRIASVVAIDWCEMAVLDKDVVLSVYKSHPDLYEKLQQDVHKRTASQAQEDAEEFTSGSASTGGSGTESINTSYVPI